MKNRITILIAVTVLMTACGTMKKAAGDLQQGTGVGQTETSSTGDPRDAVIATLGDWQTLQSGGNIALKGGNNFSSSMQIRMVRGQSIYISLRPLLGIEVGKLLITADSVYAVDKVHKRYIAEKVSLLTAGIPVTVTDVQDIFLGRPFVIGKGTLNEALKDAVNASHEGNTLSIAPVEGYKGYGYAFTFDKNCRITSLDIVRQGGTTPAYQVKYSDVKRTDAGNVAHDIDVNAVVDKKKVAFSMSYKNIDWNGSVKIDRNIPANYQRMSAADLFSMFSN